MISWLYLVQLGRKPVLGYTKIHNHRALNELLGVNVIVVDSCLVHKLILHVKSIWVYFSKNMLFPAFAAYYYCKFLTPQCGKVIVVITARYAGAFAFCVGNVLKNAEKVL